MIKSPWDQGANREEEVDSESTLLTLRSHVSANSQRRIIRSREPETRVIPVIIRDHRRIFDDYRFTATKKLEINTWQFGFTVRGERKKKIIVPGKFIVPGTRYTIQVLV